MVLVVEHARIGALNEGKHLLEMIEIVVGGEDRKAHPFCPFMPADQFDGPVRAAMRTWSSSRLLNFAFADSVERI
jgi:hypothetical protein